MRNGPVLKNAQQKPALRLVSHAQKPKIAVIIPAYNEQVALPGVLAELSALQKARPRWDILPIVVDDGSTDGTASVLERLAPLHRARVISLPLNLGIGRTVQTGFRAATAWGADVSVQLDGDGQHPAEQIPLIVGPVLARRASVVVGSRYVRGAGGNVSTSLRQAMTRAFSLLLRALAGIRVRDATSGFRAFDADATEFLSRAYPDDYPEVQAYVPLARAGFSIREIGVRMRRRQSGRSSIDWARSLYYVVKVSFATTLDRFRPVPPRKRSRDGR